MKKVPGTTFNAQSGHIDGNYFLATLADCNALVIVKLKRKFE